MASDGIYNEGFNPLYANTNFNAPVYTILLGDTSMNKDVFISSIRNNKISYLGNETPIEISLQADKMKGEKLLLELFNHTEDPLHVSPIYSKNIKVLKKEEGIF